MNIILPERLKRETLADLTNQLVTEAGDPLHEEYIFDFETCKKDIEPIGVTVLHGMVTWLLSKGKSVDFLCVEYDEFSPEHVNPQKFLDDCGFFEGFIGNRINLNSSLREDTVALQDVMLDNFNHWLNHSFIPWLSRLLNKSSKEVESFKACLEEIFNNVRDHADIHFSNIFAQYYPESNSITITIGDIGVGIIEHIKSFPQFAHFTDEEALRNAVKRNFTTQTTPHNRGAGLDMLIHNVVANAGGTVYILTNRGILESRLENGHMIQEYRSAESFYPGTHIEIKIDVSKAENLFDNVEEDFSW
ncbi:hypothetical protein [Sporosarcina sp. FSL K6-2383]|uniref:hypothetical protein n=1 Tax=Sporosarcina sp. FSL K6-2383 TaxID=2921556 RepID=UPI00315B0D44